MSKSLAWMAVPADPRHGDRSRGQAVRRGRFAAGNGTIYMMAPGWRRRPVRVAVPLLRQLRAPVRRASRPVHAAPAAGPGPAVRHGRAAPVPRRPALMAGRLAPGRVSRWCAVVHSTGQLRDKYGEHGADTVWSTAGTKLFLPGIHDPKTLEDVVQAVRQPVRRRQMRARDAARAAGTAAGLACPGGQRQPLPVVVRFRPHWRRLDVRLGRAPSFPYLGRPAARSRSPARR